MTLPRALDLPARSRAAPAGRLSAHGLTGLSILRRAVLPRVSTMSRGMGRRSPRRPFIGAQYV